MPHENKPVFAVYFLVSVVAFTYSLGESISTIVEVLRWRRLVRLFEAGLTEELLDRMDVFEDNQVCSPEVRCV